MSKFLVVLVLSIISAPCMQLGFAQSSPPVSYQPVIAENVSWTVTYTTKNKNEDLPLLERTSMGLNSQVITKVGTVKKVEDTFFNGKSSDTWVIGEMVIMQRPDWKKGKTAMLFPQESAYQFYGTQFPDVSLAKPEKLKGEESIEGVKCLRFEDGNLKLWINKQTFYPVRFENEMEIRNFKFSKQPPTALEIPELIKKKMERYGKIFSEEPVP